MGLDAVLHGFFVTATLRGAAELRPIGAPFVRSEAEAAFSVETDWQSHGVGSALLERTLLTARNRGIQHLHMACLADNRRMQQLARKFDAELSLRFRQRDRRGRDRRTRRRCRWCAKWCRTDIVSRPLSWTRNPDCSGQPDVNHSVPFAGLPSDPVRDSRGGRSMGAEQLRHPGTRSQRGIEDHHAHLLRLDYLDRCLFFSVGNDDRAVDAHCLRLAGRAGDRGRRL